MKKNANNCWHFFYIYKQDKFHAQLNWPSKRFFILLCWCSGMSVYSLGARMILLVLFMRGHTDDWVGLVKAHRRLRVVKRCFRKIESSPCYLYYYDRKRRSAALNYLCFESTPKTQSTFCWMQHVTDRALLHFLGKWNLQSIQFETQFLTVC